MLEQIHVKDVLDLIRGSLGCDLNIDIQVHDLLPSTNEYIFEQLQLNALKNKTAVIALEQTAGKGRLGRVWVSPPGNLYFSYYWQHKGTLEQLYGLSLTSGIAVARVLKMFGLTDVQLKWPNDIFWNGHKMGGILIETKTKEPGVIDTVIGIGLNIQNMAEHHSEISQKYVELESALQRKIYKNKLLAHLLIEIDRILEQFTTHGFAAFTEEWKSYDTQQGKVLSDAKEISRN